MTSHVMTNPLIVGDFTSSTSSIIESSEIHFSNAADYSRNFNSVQFARDNFINPRLPILVVTSSRQSTSLDDPEVVQDIFLDWESFANIFPLIQAEIYSKTNRSLINVFVQVHHSDQARRMITHSWPTSIVRYLADTDLDLIHPQSVTTTALETSTSMSEEIIHPSLTLPPPSREGSTPLRSSFRDLKGWLSRTFSASR